MKRIYLDCASLTPIDPRVLREMKKYYSPEYANPSSLYREGVAAKKALEEGRKMVADFIHAHADEVVFTSGGTEANGLALEGAGRAAHRNGIAKPHIIISAIEHSSIMETAAMLEKHGVSVTRLPVDARGIISLEELKKSITPDTFMVSIMTVNNETGVIQPIREIVKIVRDWKKQGSNHPSTSSGQAKISAYPLFHTDAAQALYEDLNMEKTGIDLLTLDSSKMYGPRSTGCLYIRRGTPIEPIVYGGGQEAGMRSGTENIPAVRGFAKALEIIQKEGSNHPSTSSGQAKKQKESARLLVLRTYFIDQLKRIRPDIVIHGEGGQVSPHILNVSIPGIDNEFFVLQLDAKGIACSTKSSCLRDEDESYVLKAIGADSSTSVRFSFGRWTKKGHVKKAIRVIETVLGSSNNQDTRTKK